MFDFELVVCFFGEENFFNFFLNIFLALPITPKYTKIGVNLKIDRFFYFDFQRIETMWFSQSLRSGYKCFPGFQTTSTIPV